MVCGGKWFGLASTAGDALAAQESVHPYTAAQIAEWNEMAHRAGPWGDAAALALLASVSLFIFSKRSSGNVSAET